MEEAEKELKDIIKNLKEKSKPQKLPTIEDLEQIYQKVNEETNTENSLLIPDFFDVAKEAFPSVDRDRLLSKLLELDEREVICLSEANKTPKSWKRKNLMLK